MGNNVNTIPSIDNSSISIRWLTFSPTKDNEIDAKKLKIGKGGYVPEVGKEAKNTYIIVKNDVWDRYVKVDSKKLRKIPGATIKSEEKRKACEKRLEQKYTKKDSINR